MQYVELNQFQNEFRELSNKFQENEKIIQVNFDEPQIIKMFSLSEKVKLIHFDWENVFNYDSENAMVEDDDDGVDGGGLYSDWG